MLQPESPRPRRIEVWVNSGQKDEKMIGARILAVDRESDLAVLDVGGTAGLPPPLLVKPARHLRETQRVYVIGFPLGSQLGREVSVRDSTVTALRKLHKDSDHIQRVQLQGGMDPGNSGGPIVDRRGDVVGVAVSGILGTQIRFAIPGEHVHVIMNGRLAEMSTGQPFVAATATAVPVTLTMIDPRAAIKDVAVEVWAGPPGSPRAPALGTAPPARPGDSPRQRVPMTYRGGEAMADVPLPPLPPGQVYWLQPAWVNGAGEKHWAMATTYEVKSPPVERKPAQIVYRAPLNGSSRRVDLVSTSTFKLRDDNGDLVNHQLRITTQLTERALGANAGGYTVGLRFGKFDVQEERNGRQLPTRSRFESMRSNMPRVQGGYRVERSGNLQHGKPDLRLVSPNAREHVEMGYEQVQHALEAMSVPLPPNKVVQVNESWRARRTLPLDTPGKFETGALEMTYIYLGSRKREGREEAVIALAGQIEAPEGRAAVLGGKASGTALVDVATGRVRMAQVSVVLDMEALILDEPIKVIASMDVVMKRSD